MSRTLSDLRPEQSAALLHVGGERAFRRRLLELGFLPGTVLRVVRRVAIGDVLEVELRDSRVSLRISEAAVLEVEAEGAGCASGGCGRAAEGAACATPDAHRQHATP